MNLVNYWYILLRKRKINFLNLGKQRPRSSVNPVAMSTLEPRLWSVNTVSCWLTPELGQERHNINWGPLLVPEGREGGIFSKGCKSQLELGSHCLIMGQFEHQNKTKLSGLKHIKHVKIPENMIPPKKSNL